MSKQVQKRKKITKKASKVTKTKKKPIKYTSIYTKVDEIIKNTPEPKPTETDNPLALPVTVLPPNVPWRRVMGVSFTDYAEHKYLGADGVNDPWIQKYAHVNIPKNYTPYLRTDPINVVVAKNGMLTTKSFTAAEIKQFGRLGIEPEYVIFKGAITPKGTTQKKIIWPKYYQNPYQYQDFIYLQDIYANTIAGRILDAVTYFVMANGVHPKIRVKNENQFTDDKAKRKFLDEHQWMIDVLEEIDKNVSTSSQPKAFGEETDDGIPNIGPMGTAKDEDTATYDTSLQKKWKSICIMALTFGRACIIPRIDEKDNKVTVMEENKEVTYKNIPKIILPIHTRDMGFNYVDYLTHRLLGIQLNNSNWVLRPDEMIFWENKPDNPVYGSKYYGMSEMQSMLGSARTIRQIIEVDLPLIAKTRWSGMYWIVFKRKFQDVGTSDSELTAILANVELNGINASLEDDPEHDFVLHKIDLDPKIGDLLLTVKDMIQYMQGQVGLPQGILYGEQDLNRDTLSKKISTWEKSYIKDKRNWFLEPVSEGWYKRLAKTLEKQSKKWEKALKEIEVYAGVEPFRLEDLQNQLQILMTLENIFGAFKDEARADFLDNQDIPNMIDPDKGPEDVPPMPGGQGAGMTITEQGSNRSFGVK